MKEARKYLKILVVEDNPGDFVLIEEYLTEALLSPEIHHVQTYNEVENELNINTKFDVILLDLSLPDLSGESLVKNMVEISGFIPIVVLTGYENQDFGLKTLSMGVSDYLLKDEISPFLLGKVIAYSIERNKINQTLKTSEKQYRDLFDFSPQPMWVFDLKDLKFLDVNKAAINHYGYSRYEFLDMTIMDIRPPEDTPEISEILRRASYNPDILNEGVFRHIKKNGTEIKVEIETSPINFNGEKSRLVLAKDVTEVQRYQQELQSSLAEKETLLAEIHHRVKNNLAVVSGMMQLQAFESDNEDLQAKLYDSVFRIKTMATVHELLYQSNSFSRLEFSETMKKLIENVSDTLKTDKEIEIDINCKKVTLNINQAIPASLIVNEVLTNAFKHAFTNKDSGEIKFLLSESGDKIHMEISDDGKGILENNIVKEASLGYHLIQVLSEQLGGEFEYKNQNPGTIFTLYFKKEDKKRGVGNAKM